MNMDLKKQFCSFKTIYMSDNIFMVQWKLTPSVAVVSSFQTLFDNI